MLYGGDSERGSGGGGSVSAFFMRSSHNCLKLTHNG
jgi:hypothetical protein